MNINWRNRYAYMEAAGDGAGAGDASGGGGAGASVVAPVAGDPAGGTGSASLLAAGAAAISGQGTPNPDPNAWVPEKLRITKDDGALDLEASSRKMAEAYSSLEKRLGTGDAPPKSPEEYAPKIEIDGFDIEQFKADPMTKGFLKGAHAKGMTNDQVSYVLGEYFKNAPELVTASKMLDQEYSDGELRKVWKDDESYQNNLGGAFQAFQAFSQKAGVTMQEVEASGLANHPLFLRIMAAVAPELGEDQGTNPGDASVQRDDITTLLTSAAYMDPKHPDHADVSAKVSRHYKSKYPQG